MRWLLKLGSEGQHFVYGVLLGAALGAVTFLALMLWTVTR